MLGGFPQLVLQWLVGMIASQLQWLIGMMAPQLQWLIGMIAPQLQWLIGRIAPQLQWMIEEPRQVTSALTLLQRQEIEHSEVSPENQDNSAGFVRGMRKE